MNAASEMNGSNLESIHEGGISAIPKVTDRRENKESQHNTIKVELAYLLGRY